MSPPTHKIQEQERERRQALEAMVGEFEYEDDHDDEKKLQKRTHVLVLFSSPE